MLFGAAKWNTCIEVKRLADVWNFNQEKIVTQILFQPPINWLNKWHNYYLIPWRHFFFCTANKFVRIFNADQGRKVTMAGITDLDVVLTAIEQVALEYRSVL
jgi:hypothetical protein